MSQSEAAIQKYLGSFFSSNDHQPFLLLLGPDQIRRERIETLIFNRYSALQAEKLSKDQVQSIDGRELRVADIPKVKDQLATLSLFSKSQIHALRHVQSLNAAVSKQIAELCGGLTPGGSFLLLVGDSLAKKHPLYALAKKAGCLVEFGKLSSESLVKWTRRELQQAGFEKFDKKVVDALLEISEKSPDAIYRYISHLALYLNSTEIRENEIYQLFSHVPNPNEFKLLDAIQAGSAPKAEALMHELLASGKSPFLLLSLLSRSYSNFIRIRHYLERKVSTSEMQAKLGMHPFAFKKSLATTKRTPLVKLERGLASILRADVRLKSRSLGPEVIFSQLVHELAG